MPANGNFVPVSAITPTPTDPASAAAHRILLFVRADVLPVHTSPCAWISFGMKTLLLLTFLASPLTAGAQTIEAGNHSTTGYVKADGTIEDSSHSTKGYIKKDGTIENASHSTIGYLKPDGTVENSSHGTVGYVKKDGTVENSSHSTIGYVKSDGTVEGPSHATIGYAKGVPREWAAVVFFFFKFN